MRMQTELMLDAVTPDPSVGIAQHASENWYLREEHGHKKPGYFDVSFTPYLNKIMECLQWDSPYEQIFLRKGAQLGGTSVSLAFLLWVANNGSSNSALVVFPTEKMSQRFVKRKFRPAVNSCESLRKKLMARSIERESLDLFNFPGGAFSFANAHAPSTLRMDSVSICLLSEISSYPRDNGDGDPYLQALGRTNTFEGKRKIFCESTPGTEGECRITEACNNDLYEQWRYYLPCPECKEFFIPQWSQFKWPKDLSDIYLQCPHNECKIIESEKKWMLNHAEWRQENKIKARQIAFAISSLIAPLGMYSWRSARDQFLSSKDDPSQLKVFINNILGEPWKQSISISKRKLKKKIKKYKVNPLPEGCGIVVAGVDIGDAKTGSAIEIVGFGRGFQSWGLAYYRIKKDPTSNEFWKELNEYLRQTFTLPHSGKKVRIAGAAVDSGYLTDYVNGFVRTHYGSGRNIISIKGIQGEARPIISMRSEYTRKGNIPVYSVSANTSNETLFSWLNVETPGTPGYCTFPDFYTKTGYFDELTAMRKSVVYRNGRQVTKWEQDPSKRCEGNDCRRYAIANLYYLINRGFDLDKHMDFIENMEKK